MVGVVVVVVVVAVVVVVVVMRFGCQTCHPKDSTRSVNYRADYRAGATATTRRDYVNYFCSIRLQNAQCSFVDSPVNP